MKTIILKFTAIALILAGSFFSCKTIDEPDPEDEFDPVYSDAIVGKWIWIQTFTLTAPGPMTLTPKNTGATESIIFTSDSTWSKIKNKVVVEFGEKFTIGHGVNNGSFSDVFPEYDSILYIKNGIPIRIDYFKIEENNLIFSGMFRGYIDGSKRFKRSK